MRREERERVDKTYGDDGINTSCSAPTKTASYFISELRGTF